MTRPRLRALHQPRWLRVILGLFEFLSSLQLAVPLILLFAALLAGATLLDHAYGDASKAASYAIYGTWWFAALNVLLGVNVLAAALIRIPWKRAQIGFLLTHAGILVMLSGAAISRARGIDASLSICEGQAAWRALADGRHFTLSIDRDPAPASATRDTAGVEALPEAGAGKETIEVPFAAGPFNWDEYRHLTWNPCDGTHLCWFPWALARRDQGVIYDRDGVRLEVLDYYSDSQTIAIPQVKLRVRADPDEPDGPASGGDAGTPVTLAVRGMGGGTRETGRPYGVGDRTTLAGAQELLFWMTGDADELAAFCDAQPEGPLGPLGQVVLHAAGRKFCFSVEQLQRQKEQALGDTGLVIEQVRFQARFLGVQLQVRRGNDPPELMFLFVHRPEFNHHDYRHRVFGDFWFDPRARDAHASIPAPDERLLHQAQSPRIDLLQGPDQKLYYRAWRAPQLGSSGRVPNDGSWLSLWGKAEPASAASDGPCAVALRVEQYRPSLKPELRIAPLAFSRDKSRLRKHSRVQVRLTVDGKSEEFWLSDNPAADEAGRAGTPVVGGKDRRVAVALGWNEVDVGFQVFLQRFQRKLEPGTSHAWYYASLVDLVDRHDATKRLQANVLISMNEPADFSDPSTGRSYRLYQEGFDGPFRPGDPEYEQIVHGQELRDQAFLTQLSVNYDPGRGLKYAGSFLVTLGLFIVFYLKAFFYRRRAHAPKPR